jgi:AcrR family transcriptional regulator
VPRGRVLAAADALFAGTNAPEKVSMDDIAAAAGVGKGTLFRAFGSRVQLITAVFDARITPLREAVDAGKPPLGPGTPPVERITAILAELLDFKIQNRYLTRALETAGGQMFESAFYRWIHGRCSSLLSLAAPDAEPGYADYAAHVLLGALRTDLADELLDVQKISRGDLMRRQATLVRRLTGGVGS